MAIVKLGVPEIEVTKVDHGITVWNTKKAKIGTLIFREGLHKSCRN
ncbi:hypothetical protein [Paraburkholderia sp. BCC1885]|nr:hypothetical protein [Paraburkholderia sp. BCC1885]